MAIITRIVEIIKIVDIILISVFGARSTIKRRDPSTNGYIRFLRDGFTATD